MQLFLTFVILQALDAASTLVFLRHGVSEANPLIRMVLAAIPAPAAALALAKLGAGVLALAAWRSGRLRLLRRINLLFVACVAWNLLALTNRGV
jgi:uncharacterized protein DUF5658